MQSPALEFSAPRRVDITEVELPPLGRGDVLVRTAYSGISSGTELLAYRGEIDPATPLDEALGALQSDFSFPFRYGYSCVGHVEEARGPIAEGGLVFCFHPHQQLFVCKTEDLIPVDGVDARVATMFPLVETALQISLDAGAVAHETVVVMGMGAVGILSAVLLGRVGADVIGVDPLAWRNDVAESCGIHAVTPEAVAGSVAERTEDKGAPLVVEASGNPAALAHALDLLAHEGRALVASWYGRKPVMLPLGERFHRRRLEISSSQVSTIPARLSGAWTLERRRREALRLLSELPLKPLATHEFDFRDAQRAFEALDEGREGLMHAALTYGDV